MAYIIAIVCLALFVNEWGKESVRYRLALEVDDNGTIRTGASVIEVTFHDDGWLGAVPPTVRGNAVTVDLGEKGMLAVLLTGDMVGNTSLTHAGLVVTTYLSANWELDDVENIEADGRKIPIPVEKLPLTIIIPDPTNPDTMRRIDPRRLATSFGDGVKLLSATIEITDDPISTGIEKRLLWLQHDDGNYLGGQRNVNYATARLVDKLKVQQFRE